MGTSTLQLAGPQFRQPTLTSLPLSPNPPPISFSTKFWYLSTVPICSHSTNTEVRVPKFLRSSQLWFLLHRNRSPWQAIRYFIFLFFRKLLTNLLASENYRSINHSITFWSLNTSHTTFVSVSGVPGQSSHNCVCIYHVLRIIVSALYYFRILSLLSIIPLRFVQTKKGERVKTKERGNLSRRKRANEERCWLLIKCILFILNDNPSIRFRQMYNPPPPKCGIFLSPKHAFWLEITPFRNNSWV